MKLAAAIDLGTNSTRLLIAEVDAEGAVHDRVRRQTITRLGADVHATRSLSADAIERTLAALRAFRSDLDAHANPPLRVIATSAARDATNRDALFTAVADVLGEAPELLTGNEEAALSFVGATTGIDRSAYPPPYLVVDIGGGSTELVYGTDAARRLVSLDVGCVRVSEMFLASDPPAPEELSNAVGYVRDLLADVDRVMPDAKLAQTCLMVAGTATTMAMVDQAMATYDRDAVHGFGLTRAAAEDIFRMLALDPAAERALHPGLEPGRVDTIVGGVIIAVCVMRHYDLDEVVVSELDILDGLIRSQVAGIPAS